MEGEEGRGSVKVPFITAMKALPSSASACRARNHYDVRCCATSKMFAKRSWYACPDIHQCQNFQDENCLASIAQAVQTDACQKTAFLVNSLVFIYIPFGHSLSAQFLGLKGLGNGGNRIACLIRGEAVLIAQTHSDF